MSVMSCGVSIAIDKALGLASVGAIGVTCKASFIDSALSVGDDSLGFG